MVKRIICQILDHVFDIVPALILLAFLVATSNPFVVTFEF